MRTQAELRKFVRTSPEFRRLSPLRILLTSRLGKENSHEKKIEVKKVEGNGEFEEVEDHKKALADHIKKQMEERDNVKETVKSLDAIQHPADILQVEGRLHRLEDIIVALQEEELPVLPEYQEKVKELGEHLS